MSILNIAQNLNETYLNCDPDEALPAGDPRYVDLSEVRDGDNHLSQMIARRIMRHPAPKFHKELVTGHRGCGKSTELHRLRAELQSQNYFAVYLDIEDVLDLGEITYQDVLLSIALGVERGLREKEIFIDEKLLTNLRDWFADTIRFKEIFKDESAQIGTELKIGSEIPFLGGLLAKLTANIRSGSSQREEIRQALERELEQFILRLNALLKDAREKVQEKGHIDLVVIVDGLEKMHYRVMDDGESTHSTLFVHHAEQLKDPACHIIYTTPISLAYNANVGDSFSGAIFVLPMIQYKEEAGIRCLMNLINKRVNIATVFEDLGLLEQLIALSGGAMRDLMRLMRMSCEGTGDKITQADIDRARRVFVREFERLIKTDDIAVLKKVWLDKRVTADECYARPLQLRLIHEYIDGKRYADLHPTLLYIDWLMEKLNAA